MTPCARSNSVSNVLLTGSCPRRLEGPRDCPLTGRFWAAVHRDAGLRDDAWVNVLKVTVEVQYLFAYESNHIGYDDDYVIHWYLCHDAIPKGVIDMSDDLLMALRTLFILLLSV